MKTDLSQVPESTKIRAVICAMIVNFMIGAYYFFSNINPYVAAYLRSFNPSVTAKDTLIIMPIYIVCQSLGTIISIKLCERFGYPSVSNCSYAMFSLCSLVMVFVKSYWIFVFVYGVVTGLMIGFGYMPSLFIAWTYYPDKKSIVTGISLFTAGISASILSPMSTAIVNPEDIRDYETDPRVFQRVPTLFFCLFLCYGSLTVLCAILQPPPFQSEEVKELEELKKVEEELVHADKNSIEMHNYPPQSSHQDDHKAINNSHPINDGSPLQPHQAEHLGEKDLRYIVNREISHDTRGYISQPEAFAMAVLPPEQLLSITDKKDSIQVLIHERRDSIRRMSIRFSLRKFEGPDHLKLASGMLSQVDSFQTFNKLNKHEVPEEAKIQKEMEIRESINKILEEIHHDCPSLEVALKSRVFLALCFMAYSCSVYNYFMNSAWKQYYVTKIEVSDKQMALILSYGSFANSIVRVASGFLMMKYDFKYIFLGLIASTIICCFTIDAFLVNYAIGAIYSMSVFGGIGIQVTIFPTVCTKVFGPLIGPKVFPFVFSFFSMANLTQFFMLKFTDNWTIMFWLYGFLAIGGLVVGLTFSSTVNWTKAIYDKQSPEKEPMNPR